MLGTAFISYRVSQSLYTIQGKPAIYTLIRFVKASLAGPYTVILHTILGKTSCTLTYLVKASLDGTLTVILHTIPLFCTAGHVPGSPHFSVLQDMYQALPTFLYCR